MALQASISKGIVVQSEFFATMKDAPNSPNDIAMTNIEEMIIEPFRRGILILINLENSSIPKTRAFSSYELSRDLIAGSMILTTNGVVSMM